MREKLFLVGVILFVIVCSVQASTISGISVIGCSGAGQYMSMTFTSDNATDQITSADFDMGTDGGALYRLGDLLGLCRDGSTYIGTPPDLSDTTETRHFSTVYSGLMPGLKSEYCHACAWPDTDATVTAYINGNCPLTGTYFIPAGTSWHKALFSGTCDNSGLNKITVDSPNGGESWEPGNTYEIRWTRTGSMQGLIFDIELLKGGAFNKTLRSVAVDFAHRTQSYSWTIPEDQETGNDYQIRVTNIGAISYSDTSDASFFIGPKTLTVTSPDGGESWEAGTQHSITWSQTGLSGTNVKIDLYMQPYGSPAFYRHIVSSVPAAAGSYTWTIPTTYSSLSFLKAKITSLAYPGVSDYSDGVWAITPVHVYPLPGHINPPTDPDIDGIYEDLNANGRLDFADVVLYFNQMTWIGANEPVSAFDLNKNGRIDFADIVALFNEI